MSLLPPWRIMRCPSGLLLLALSVVLAGCTTGGGGGGSEGGQGGGSAPQGLAQPVTVYEETLDFSTDPSGAEKTAPVEAPADARSLTLSAQYRAKAPITSTNQVTVVLRDGTGAVLADCSMGINGVTQAEPTCEGQPVDVQPGESYVVAWSGFGTVEADVRVVAS